MTIARTSLMAVLVVTLGACAAERMGPAPSAPVRLIDRGPNAISLWDERAAALIGQPPAAIGTPEERRPIYSLDMATLHLSIYEAMQAAPLASHEAAAHAAAYTVLKNLFPQRAEQVQAFYDSALAALPAGTVNDEGLRIGGERAARVLTSRADDGRWADVPTAVPGITPGAFRGVNPVGQTLLRVRPFVIASAAQFHGAPPPALDSATMVADLDETRRRGGEATAATAREDEDARFHTEAPPRFWTRNLNRFARSQLTLSDNARLMALLWITHADSGLACFNTKFHYYRWRPQSAIPLTDPAWKPRVPTPNHPEYPATHGCVTAAFTESLAAYFGTRHVVFAFDSTVTNTTHEFATVDDMVREVREARIVGGMHFRHSVAAGEKIGVDVARAASRDFLR